MSMTKSVMSMIKIIILGMIRSIMVSIMASMIQSIMVSVTANMVQSIMVSVTANMIQSVMVSIVWLRTDRAEAVQGEAGRAVLPQVDPLQGLVRGVGQGDLQLHHAGLVQEGLPGEVVARREALARHVVERLVALYRPEGLHRHLGGGGMWGHEAGLWPRGQGQRLRDS